MRKTASKQNFPLIRAGLVLLIVLLAIYIPLKLYMANSNTARESGIAGTTISIFATNELRGYREPCG